MLESSCPQLQGQTQPLSALGWRRRFPSGCVYANSYYRSFLFFPSNRRSVCFDQGSRLAWTFLYSLSYTNSILLNMGWLQTLPVERRISTQWMQPQHNSLLLIHTIRLARKSAFKMCTFKDTSIVYKPCAFNDRRFVISPLSFVCLLLWASTVLFQAGLVVLLRLSETPH